VSNLGGYHSREQLFCSRNPSARPGLQLLEAIATAAIQAADLEDGGDEEDESMSASSAGSSEGEQEGDPLATEPGELEARSSAAVPKESWVNVSRQGHANGLHHHEPSTWSGVYYTANPRGAVPSSGKIIFRVSEGGFAVVNGEDSGSEAAAGAGRKKKKKGWCRYVAADPQPGDLLLFPAWLKHCVLPFQPKAPGATRVSVAFNA